MKRKREWEPTQCQICRSTAVYRYFGVISCEACKVFFKRNGLHGQVSFIFFQFSRRYNSFIRIISNVYSTINVKLIQTIVKDVHRVDSLNVFKRE